MKEDIIRMAREAGIADAFLAEPHPGVMTQLERFAALVAAADRPSARNARGYAVSIGSTAATRLSVLTQ